MLDPPPPCVTFRRVVAPLRGPGQSPVLPFACCVGSLRSVGRCGRCSCWCRFRVRGAQSLVCRGCAECGGMCRLCVSSAQLPPPPPPQEMLRCQAKPRGSGGLTPPPPFYYSPAPGPDTRPHRTSGAASRSSTPDSRPSFWRTAPPTPPAGTPWARGLWAACGGRGGDVGVEGGHTRTHTRAHTHAHAHTHTHTHARADALRLRRAHRSDLRRHRRRRWQHTPGQC